MKAEFVCPCLFPWSTPLYDRLTQLMEERPHLFRPYATIHAVFGCFANFKWNGGGKNMFGDMPTEEIIVQTLDFYGNKGIDVYLTATNPCIEERDLHDRYANMTMRLAEEKNDHVKVLVASPILEAYLRETYPGLKIIKSIIASEHIVDYNAEIKNYEQMVLGRPFAFDIDKMKTINEEDRGRYEILLNDECNLDCPRLYSHYVVNGPVMMFISEPDETPGFHCTAPAASSQFAIELQRFHVISPQELEEIYMPMGYSKFKISGRTANGRILREMLPFIVKPEFQTEIYYDVIRYTDSHPVSVYVKDNVY